MAWAFARHDGRTFHMRIEDLDERSRPEYVTRQLEDLTKIGVTWDGPELFQSKRLERYEEVFSGLASQDWLYECFCTRKELANVVSAPHQPPGSYPGTCRNLTADEREQRRARFNGTNRGAAYRLKPEKIAEVCMIGSAEPIKGPSMILLCVAGMGYSPIISCQL